MYATCFFCPSKNYKSVEEVFFGLLGPQALRLGKPVEHSGSLRSWQTIEAYHPEYVYIYMMFCIYRHKIYVLCNLCNMYIMNPDCWVHRFTFSDMLERFSCRISLQRMTTNCHNRIIPKQPKTAWQKRLRFEYTKTTEVAHLNLSLGPPRLRKNHEVRHHSKRYTAQGVAAYHHHIALNSLTKCPGSKGHTCWKNNFPLLEAS